MSVVLRGITIDNGGSQARVLPIEASIPEGIIKLENDFVTIDEANFRVKETANPEELCRVVDATDNFYLGIIARGLTGKMYSGHSMEISSQSQKTSTDNYYKQLVYAVAIDALRAHREFSRQVSDVIFKYAVVTCIPIREHSGNKECASVLKRRLAGSYTVEFPLMEGCPRVSFEISEDCIGVVPEGGVAIVAMKGIVGEDEISLLVDMGHVTTDLALYKGTNLLGQVISSQFAGSTLNANVMMALNDEGYIISEDQMEKVMSTMQVQDGAKKIDVSDIINEQKRMFVENFLKKDIVRLLNANKVNVKQISRIVPIGAPMNLINGQNEIQNAIRECCGMVNADINIIADDLRFVNITYASKFTKRLMSGVVKKMNLEVI